MRNRLLFSAPLLALCAVFSLRAADEKAFDFKPNDRIVFIGDATIERDIYHNYLETMMTVRLHGKGVTFRNAGWSGDTVWGESRAVFGTQKDGYNSLIKIINETRPSVAVLNYGFNESFAGKEGLDHFEAGYNALLDNVLNPEKDAEFVSAPPAQAKNRRDPKDVPTGNKPIARPVPRVILISPIAFQRDEAPAAARNPHVNENLKLYSEAIRKIAEKRGARFIDVFTAFSQPNATPKLPLTDDGAHLTAFGYRKWAATIDAELNSQAVKWEGFGATVEGKYVPVNYPAPAGGDSSLVALQQTIQAKNLQFFNKWRPQNETYLFLFRKHEQGRNAKEIPEFDPFIEAKEAEISKQAEAVAKKLGL